MPATAAPATTALTVPGSYFAYLADLANDRGEKNAQDAVSTAFQAARSHGAERNRWYRVEACLEVLDWIAQKTQEFLDHGSISAQTPAQRTGALNVRRRTSAAVKALTLTTPPASAPAAGPAPATGSALTATTQERRHVPIAPGPGDDLHATSHLAAGMNTEYTFDDSPLPAAAPRPDLTTSPAQAAEARGPRAEAPEPTPTQPAFPATPRTWISRPCDWCGTLWSVVRVAHKTRAIGAQEQHSNLCKDICLARMKTLSECQGRTAGLYEYVREVTLNEALPFAAPTDPATRSAGTAS